MLMVNDRAILLADGMPEQAHFVSQLLRQMDYRVVMATRVDEMLEIIAREILDRAIVAVEMAMDGEPILSRLARLPAQRRLVATGPAGDVGMERLARQAGADVYLARPVSADALAVAIHVPACREASARPP